MNEINDDTPIENIIGENETKLSDAEREKIEGEITLYCVSIHLNQNTLLSSSDALLKMNVLCVDTHKTRNLFGP